MPHTPAPWNWNGTCLVAESTRDYPDGYAVAKVFNESDVALIAAAPALLACAIDALETFERRFPDSPTAHDLRAAIRAAIGE